MRISDWSSDVCSSDLIIHSCSRDTGFEKSTFKPDRAARCAIKNIRSADHNIARAPKKPAANPKPAMNASRINPPSMSTGRSEEHTSELQSLMRISYAVFCLKTKNTTHHKTKTTKYHT